jgi:coenzyme F420-reducing hydrogenase delta subunit
LKLLSLKIEPLGQNGWESPLLEFGLRTTLIFARNGSGKTPIIQSLAASLGFPPRFRDDIFGKCASVTLHAESNRKSLIIRRIFGTKNNDFHGELIFEGEVSEYFNEGAFSIALFNSLDLEPPRLVSTVKTVSQPYISTVLPVFYLNQSDGYTAAYKSPSPFILDQFVEMVRFVFGLNPKHSFDVKKSLIEERAALEGQTRRIVAAQRVLENQSRGIDDSTVNQEILQRRSVQLGYQIESLRESVDAKGTASSTLTELLRQKDMQIQSRKNELSDLQNRVSGIETIRTEIDGEVQTLGLNEEARRVFTSFREICAAPNCGLFLVSTESYGKNLLYLKDQIKDLERNSLRAEMRIEQLEIVLTELRVERQLLASKIDSPSATDLDKLVTAVQALTKQLIEVESELGKIVALKDERSKLFKLSQERDRIQDRIDSLSNTGRADNEFNKLRNQLRELTVKLDGCTRY